MIGRVFRRQHRAAIAVVSQSPNKTATLGSQQVSDDGMKLTRRTLLCYAVHVGCHPSPVILFFLSSSLLRLHSRALRCSSTVAGWTRLDDIVVIVSSSKSLSSVLHSGPVEVPRRRSLFCSCKNGEAARQLQLVIRAIVAFSASWNLPTETLHFSMIPPAG